MTSGLEAVTSQVKLPAVDSDPDWTATQEPPMQFNHVANRFDPQYFETVAEMLKTHLLFIELRRTERAIWLRQPGANVDLQFSRGPTSQRRGQTAVADFFSEPDAAIGFGSARGIAANGTA
jgi:hypothetical protein